MAVTTSAADLPPIKCSSCGRDVELVSMASHICNAPSAFTAFDFHQPTSSLASSAHTSIIEANRRLSPLKTQTPVVPRLDASTGRRPKPTFNESRSGSSVTSPSSSGRQSPWTGSRRPSLRPSLRPPSPELISQDCAFPPFPMSKARKSSGTRDERYYASSREDSGEKRRTGHRNKSEPSSARASRLNAGEQNMLTKSRSASSGTHPRGGDAVSLASTSSATPSSRRPSVGQRVAAPKFDGVGKVPPLPSPPIFLSEDSPVITESPTSSVRLSTSSFMASSETTQGLPDATSEPFTMRKSSVPEVQTRDRTLPASMDSNDSLGPLKPQDAVAREPMYKSKRPTPLRQLGGDMDPAKVRSPTVPTPSSGGRLGQSLGRLLSRARSRSAGANRHRFPIDGNEAPPVPSPMSQSFYVPATPSPTSDNASPHSEPKQHSDASNQTLVKDRGSLQLSTTLNFTSALASTVSVEREDRPAESAVVAPQLHQVCEQAKETEDHKRCSSIYSRSSFDSVGFSHGSDSSLSSVPQSAELIKDVQRANDIITALPAAKVENVDLDLDSPTDPLLQHGSFSVIPLQSLSNSDEVHDSQELAVTEPEDVTWPLPKPENGSKGTCRGCLQTILSGQKSITSADGRLTGRYHKECFTCWTCHEAFPTCDFYVHDDRPFCAQHYHELNGTLCGICNKGIEGLYMQTSSGNGKRYHPHCLACATCQCPLESDYFEYLGRMYCEKDAFRLANLPSKYDTAPAIRSPLVREYISSIEPGLVGRFPERRTTKMMLT